MSARFCPDCGAECSGKEEQCPDCAFPLSMELQTGMGWVRFQGRGLAQWQRVAQLLSRNGVMIAQRPASGWEDQKWWWLLPGAGLLFLLSTVAFGPALAGWIWPPHQDASILEITQNPMRRKAVAEGSPVGGNLPNRPASGSTASVEPSPQGEGTDKGAAMDNGIDDQEAVPAIQEEDAASTEEWSAMEEELAPEVEGEEALLRLSQAMGKVSMNGRSAQATLLSPGGAVLVPSWVVAKAFTREERMVAEGGRIEEKSVPLVPRLSFRDRSAAAIELMMEPGNLPMAFLSSDFSLPETVEVGYFDTLSLGQAVFLLTSPEPPFSALRTSVVGERTELRSGLRLFQLTSSLGEGMDGSPVLSSSGQIVGAFLSAEGADCVVILADLINKSPGVINKIRP